MTANESRKRASNAFRAMKAIGISTEKVRPVLKSLLALYEKNWTLIEEENYRALADAIFERDESEAAQQSKKLTNTRENGFLEREAHADEELERPLKRLRRKHQDGQASSSRATEVPKIPLIKPKEEKDELSELPFVPLRGPHNVMETLLVNNDSHTMTQSSSQGKGNQAVSPNQQDRIITDYSNSPSRMETRLPSHSMRKGDRGSELEPSQVQAREKRLGYENSSLALTLKEPKVEPITNSSTMENIAGNMALIPKEEPVFDNLVGADIIPSSKMSKEDSSKGNKNHRESFGTEALESSPAAVKEVAGSSQHEPNFHTKMPLNAKRFSTNLEIACSPSGEVKMFLRLNLVPERGKFHMPKPEDVLSSAQDACILSNINSSISLSSVLRETCQCFLQLVCNSSPKPLDGAAPDIDASQADAQVPISACNTFSGTVREAEATVMHKPSQDASGVTQPSTTSAADLHLSSDLPKPLDGAAPEIEAFQADGQVPISVGNALRGTVSEAEAGAMHMTSHDASGVTQPNKTSAVDVHLSGDLGLNAMNGSLRPLCEIELDATQQPCKGLSDINELTTTGEPDAQVSSGLNFNVLNGFPGSLPEADAEMSNQKCNGLPDLTEPCKADTDGTMLIDGKVLEKSAEETSVLALKSYKMPQLASECILPLSGTLDISEGKEKIVITVVNEVNAELPPAFRYITRNVVYRDAIVNFSSSQIRGNNSCPSCSGDCLSSLSPCACARRSGGEYSYTKEGFLKNEFLRESVFMNRDPKKHWLFYCKECPVERSKCEDAIDPCKGHLVRKFVKECWLNCGCGDNCGNRVVQRGISRKLQVFMTSEGKGWGLRSLEDLPKGAFVCEYVGEILTHAELLQRASCHLNATKLSYPAVLDAGWGHRVLKDKETLSLDATYYGNVSRFINHRCYDSNLVEIPIEVESSDHHYYHLAFFTSRKVNAMEELTRDYGIDFDDCDHPFFKTFECRCGSKFCRNIKRTRGSRCNRS